MRLENGLVLFSRFKSNVFDQDDVSFKVLSIFY
jgi:hypothetical protein